MCKPSNFIYCSIFYIQNTFVLHFVCLLFQFQYLVLHSMVCYCFIHMSITLNDPFINPHTYSMQVIGHVLPQTCCKVQLCVMSQLLFEAHFTCIYCKGLRSVDITVPVNLSSPASYMHVFRLSVISWSVCRCSLLLLL